MKRYEVKLSVTVEVDAENEEQAEIEADLYLASQDVLFDLESVTEVVDI